MSLRFLAIITAVLVSLARPASAQDAQFGTEFDVLPYATGGWYASGWWGRDHVRVRAVTSDVELPDFTLKGDFEDDESRAYAALVDCFPRAGLRGPWIGSGVEHWTNRIGHLAETVKGEYTNWMFTVGGGWAFNLGRHVYLNPWAAGHVRMSGDERAQVGSRVNEPPKGLAEASRWWGRQDPRAAWTRPLVLPRGAWTIVAPVGPQRRPNLSGR